MWVGAAVSGETGICLKMIYRVRCVCSGDAADHGGVFDPPTNAHPSVKHKQTVWHVSAASTSLVRPRKRHWWID